MMAQDNIDQALGDFLDRVADQETPRPKADPLGAQEIQYQGDYIYDTVGPPPWIDKLIRVNLIRVDRDENGRPSRTWLCDVDKEGEEIRGVHYTAHAKMIPGESYLMRETYDRDTNVTWQWIKVPVSDDRWLYAQQGERGNIIRRYSWPPATLEDPNASPPWEAIEQVRNDQSWDVGLFFSNTENDPGTEMIMYARNRNIETITPYANMGFDDPVGSFSAPPDVNLLHASNLGTILVGKSNGIARRDYAATSYDVKYVEDSELLCNTPGLWQGVVWVNNHVEFVPKVINGHTDYLDKIYLWVSLDNGRSFSVAGTVDDISLFIEYPYEQHLFIQTFTCHAGECNILGGFCTEVPEEHDYSQEGSGIMNVSAVEKDHVLSAWAFQPDGPETDYWAIWVTAHVANPPRDRGQQCPIVYLMYVFHNGSMVTYTLEAPEPQVATYGYYGGTFGTVAMGYDDDNAEFVIYFQAIRGGLWVGRAPVATPHQVASWTRCTGPDFYGGLVSITGQACIGWPASSRPLLYTDDYGATWHTLPQVDGYQSIIQEA